MATLDADDLNAIDALIAARLPTDFNTLTITGGQIDGIAGPVQATDAFGDALASASSVAAVKAIADKLETTLVLDGSVYQFTVNALENAPSGSGTVSITTSTTVVESA